MKMFSIPNIFQEILCSCFNVRKLLLRNITHWF